MGMYRYVTNRTLRNKAGEESGKIRCLVKDGSDTAEVDYVCPECGNSQHVEQQWERPFTIKCSKCGVAIKLRKLKDDIKREKNKEKRKNRS